MLDIFLEKLKKVLNNRTVPLLAIFLVAFFILIQRSFKMQIASRGAENYENEETKNTQERDIASTRGNFYDRNGVKLSENVLSYSVVMSNTALVTRNEDMTDGKPSVEQRKEHIVQKAIYQFTYCDQPQWKQVIFAVKNFCRISVEIPDDHVQNREDPKIIPDTKIHQKPGKKACQYTRVLPLKKGCRNNEDQQNIRYHVRHLKMGNPAAGYLHHFCRSPALQIFPGHSPAAFAF